MNANTMIAPNPVSAGCQVRLTERPNSQRSSSRVTRSRQRALLAIGLALCAAGSAAAQSFTLTPINPPSGAAGISVTSLNNLGQIVGNTTVKAGRSTVAGPAFMWANGTAASLPSLGSDSSARANDISDSGLIVGTSGSSPARAIWWQAAAGGSYSVGNWNSLLPEGSPLFLHETIAVSQDGQFVVFDAENTVTGLWGAVVARVAAGGMTTWTIPTGGNPPVPLADSLASDIHFDGATVRVAGAYAKTLTEVGHAFLWELDPQSGAVVMSDLDSNPNRSSFANGVNGSRAAAGYIYSSAVGYQAYFWDAAGIVQQLPTLGGAQSVAFSINTGRYVTGWSARSGKNATAHAFLWHPSLGTRDLNALKSPADTSGLELTTAYKVNDAGQILAHGVNKNGGMDVLMKPVP
jgi:uncharacterized membrane protein